MFSTPIVLTGPTRSPKNLLVEQTYDGHSSVHDGDTADKLGLAGAPIEGPTHFSQLEPFGQLLWGQEWFETGCISTHFRTMVVEGETVTPTASASPGAATATVSSAKDDGAEVLTGTISVGVTTPTALEGRLAELNARETGELHILDQLKVGMTDGPVEATITRDDSNGDLYPFSLHEKLASITERSTWFESADNPWGQPILPYEMYSVLAHKVSPTFPVRRPSLGLFLDLEVRSLGSPLFVDRTYRLEREVVGLSQSRKVESYWVRTFIFDDDRRVASVLLHSGVFKASYPGYPSE